MQSRTFEIFHYQASRLDDVSLHHHDFFELYYFLRGDVEYAIEGVQYRLKKGDLLLISPRELHQARILPSTDPYERYVLWLDPLWLRSLSTPDTDLTACFDRARPGHTNRISTAGSRLSTARDILASLVQESYGGEFGSDLASVSLILQLMVEVNRMARAVSPDPERGPISSPLVSQVLSCIGMHYGEPLTLDGLAARFHVSRSHLSREFQRMVGTSVYRYILLRRLNEARLLLREGVPATEVSTRCGFQDYGNFFRAFRGRYGMGPRQYTGLVRKSRATPQQMNRS